MTGFVHSILFQLGPSLWFQTLPNASFPLRLLPRFFLCWNEPEHVLLHPDCCLLLLHLHVCFFFFLITVSLTLGGGPMIGMMGEEAVQCLNGFFGSTVECQCQSVLHPNYSCCVLVFTNPLSYSFVFFLHNKYNTRLYLRGIPLTNIFHMLNIQFKNSHILIHCFPSMNVIHHVHQTMFQLQMGERIWEAIQCTRVELVETHTPFVDMYRFWIDHPRSKVK